VNVGNTEDVDETERKTNVKWFLNCLCTRPWKRMGDQSYNPTYSYLGTIMCKPRVGAESMQADGRVTTRMCAAIVLSRRRRTVFYVCAASLTTAFCYKWSSVTFLCFGVDVMARKSLPL
jgi:hypothetical protein